MRIAFVSDRNAEDIGVWSGVPYYMLKALRSAFDDVALVRAPRYKRSGPDLDAQLQEISRVVSGEVARLGVDAVVCQGTSAVAYLKAEGPVVYWHDSTWAALFQGHLKSELTFDAFKEQHPELFRWDQLVLNRADRVYFSSDWLVEHAIRDYQVPPEKLRVLPFGANLEDPPSSAQVEEFLASRSDGCRLLFSGKDWRRKGLPLAAQLVRALRHRGISATLDVLGASPWDLRIRLTRGVSLHGFLRKSVDVERGLLEKLYRSSHFFVHPAHFECFGCALVEANAFGLPVVGTRVGGLTTIVHEGVNGALFAEPSFVEGAADYIAARHGEGRARYNDLARASWREFDQRLRWELHGAALRRDLEGLVS